MFFLALYCLWNREKHVFFLIIFLYILLESFLQLFLWLFFCNYYSKFLLQMQSVKFIEIFCTWSFLINQVIFFLLLLESSFAVLFSIVLHQASIFSNIFCTPRYRTFWWSHNASVSYCIWLAGQKIICTNCIFFIEFL